jgi:hypothetical protein
VEYFNQASQFSAVSVTLNQEPGPWVQFPVGSGAASAIIGGMGANIHIFVFTDHKNNGFQKKLIMQNTKI